MAVFKAPVRQQSYLTEYDRQMAEYLRKIGAGYGAKQIATEAYGGKFPVGTMTAKILSGVLAGASDRRAKNRIRQSDQAQIDLLDGRATEIQPQLLPNGEFAAGEYMTPEGKFVTQLAPVYQGVGQDADRAAYEARILKEQARPGEIAEREYEIRKRNREIAEEKALFNQFVSDQPNKVSYSNTGAGNGYVGTQKDPLSAVLTGNYRGEDIQPLEPLLPIQNQAVERKELYKAETTPGIMVTAEDADANPNWWERKISGDIPGVMVETRNELAQLAGYDPLEWTLAERELAKSGDGIEYSFQNISKGTLTNGTISFLTRVGSRINNGVIEQFFLDPNDGTWKPMQNTGLRFTEDTTADNRVQSGIQGRMATAKQWLNARGHTKYANDDTFLLAMANGFTGDITKENLKTGDEYGKLDAVFENLIGKKDTFNENAIITQGGLDVYKINEPMKGKILEDKVNTLAEKINKADLSTSYTTLTDLQNLIDKYPGDIPGAGYKGTLARNFMLGKDGKKIRALIATVQNRALKERSGAAVTPSEFERFEKEIPTWLSSEDNLINGLKTLRKILDAKIGTIFATEPSYISEIYMSRPNSIKLGKSNRANLNAKYNLN